MVKNRVCLVEFKHFLLFNSGEKTRKTEKRKENNPFSLIFFYHPNLEGKLGEKSAE